MAIRESHTIINYLNGEGICKLDKEVLIRIGKEGAEHNFHNVANYLPPIILVVHEESLGEEISSHSIDVKNESIAKEKIREILIEVSAERYVLIASATITEFIDKARELNSITSLAPEDFDNVLVVIYVENSNGYESHISQVSNLGTWYKVDNLLFMDNVVARSW